MKKLCSILLSLFIAIGVLASCDSKPQENVPTTTATTTTTEVSTTATTTKKIQPFTGNETQPYYQNAVETTTRKKLKNPIVEYNKYYSDGPDTLRPKYFMTTYYWEWEDNEYDFINYDEAQFYPKKYGEWQYYEDKGGIFVFVDDTFSKNVKKLEIPEQIDEKPVIGFIDFGSSYYNNYKVQIKETYLPKTVKYIGIYGSDKYLRFYIDSENPYYYSEDGAIYTKDKETLLFVNTNNREEFVIPEGTKNIAKDCFNGYSGYANNEFQGITIPKTVELIEEFDLPEIKQLDKDNPDYSMDNNALYNKDKTELITMIHGMKKYVLPKTVKTINVNADLYAEKIVLPKGFEKFKTNFMWYKLFYHNIVPKVEVEKGNRYYTSVDGILLSKDKTELYYYNYNYGTTNNITIPDSVKILYYPLTEYDLLDHSEKGIITFGKNIERIYVLNMTSYYDYDDYDLYEWNLSDRETVTIKGYKGTAAEALAEKTKIKFIALD